jgi:probable phosphoglycerate mutase
MELLELAVGTTEGMPLSELREVHGEFLRQWAGPSGHLATMPGGESLANVDERITPLIDELRGEPYPSVAVVSHNFVLRAMFCRLVGLDLASFRSVAFDLASVSVLSVKGERASVWRLNDCCHLHSLESSSQRA